MKIIEIPTLFSDWAYVVHKLATQKGWHDDESNTDAEPAYISRAVALLHSEISELYEAFRNGTLHNTCDKMKELPPEKALTNLEEEVADIIIRTLDMAARLRVDIDKAINCKHEFNRTRPLRHGGKIA